MLIVAALTAVGVALRLVVAHQSLFADELSTRFILAGHGLADMVSVVHTDAEITPPLYFVSAWFTTRLGMTPEMLRLPSLLAGAATIPLVYLLGVRTVGRRAALVAATLTTFSPFMVYYSTEARSYGMLMALVLGSTLCLLNAAEDGRARWWAAYAALTCAAVYTHYTSVFVLGAQLAWVLWTHPAARRAALAWTAVAAAGFVPWLSGFKGDLDSRTTDILSALSPLNFGFVQSSLVHWAVGFPSVLEGASVRGLPGVPALIALGLALVLGLVGLAAKLRERRLPDRGLVLVIVLAAAAPLGELLVSAVGSNLFGTRNLAVSWPGYALCLSALVVSAGPRLGIAATALAIGGFAVGGLKTLDADYGRPQSEAVVAFIDRTADPGDVVVDGASLVPAGVPSVIDLAFAGRRRVYLLGRSAVRYDPFRIVAAPPPTPDVVRGAAAAAAGGRMFLLLAEGAPTREALDVVPSNFRRVASHRYAGVNDIDVVVFEDQTASGA